jgi:hypothetical protein
MGEANLKGNGTKPAQNKNNKNNQGVNGVTPAFTGDRFLVYVVGTAVLFAGGYVIYYFVRKGLKDLEGDKGGDSKKETDSGKVGSPVLVYSETIETPSVFPIQATNLAYPTFSRDVQIAQGMLMRIFGNVLPVHGSDGKFGYETQQAVIRHVNPAGIITRADWDNLVKRALQVATQAKEATQQVQAQMKVAVMPSTMPSDTQEDVIEPMQKTVFPALPPAVIVKPVANEPAGKGSYPVTSTSDYFKTDMTLMGIDIF